MKKIKLAGRWYWLVNDGRCGGLLIPVGRCTESHSTGGGND